MSNNKLKDICGTHIKKQYFNVPIYVLLLICFLTCEMVTFSAVINKQFELQKCLYDIGTITVNFAFFIIPCMILSLLNRFLFGKIICVINNSELHYKDGIIKLEDIISIKYHITHISRLHYRPAYVELVCKNNKIKITSAPIYLFTVIKKKNPSIKTNYDKSVWITIIGTAIIGIVLSAL